MTRHASDTDKSARKTTPRGHGDDGENLGSRNLPPDQVEQTLLPIKAAEEDLGQSVSSAAAETDEVSVKQQLSPLTSQDEVDLTLPPDPELEVNATVIVQQVVSYQTPKVHRRRPGNSFELASRNFVVELKVRKSDLAIASQSSWAACVVVLHRCLHADIPTFIQR